MSEDRNRIPPRPNRTLKPVAFAAALALLGSVQLDGQSSLDLPRAEIVDEVSPEHAAIDATDFAGVFSRVTLPDLQTVSEVDDCLDQLESASTADKAASQVPAAAMQNFPEVIDFIENGTPMSFVTISTGEQVPPAPAAGGTLLPGLPAPYGLYPVNPTNNWGMPNSPTGGCGPRIVRGSGLYFDFTRACRQHDLAYRWTPVPPSQRQTVENRFLQEMLYDCSQRGPVTSRLCAIRALLYFAGTSILGGSSYGGTLTPGYNTSGTAIDWNPPYTSCAQTSHAWIFTEGFGARVPRTKSLFFTGVVRQLSRARFELVAPDGHVALRHMTRAARENCVIHHEPEEVPAGLLPDGTYQARVLFTPWETEAVTQVDLGPLEIFTPTGSTSCNQYSHAWVAGINGPVTAGTTLYPTGIVRPFTTARFAFVLRTTGATVHQHITASSRANCVIHHEPEAMSTAGWPTGVYDIVATYTEWETDASVSVPVGVLDLRPGGGGGGGGGGGIGGCPHRDPTTCW